jgi:hypothetical protein
VSGAAALIERAALSAIVEKAASRAVRAQPERPDPIAFARQAGIEPDDWQTEVLRTANTPGTQVLLNCSRQVGKSTVTGLLAAYGALHDPGSLTLILGPADRQSTELYRKCLDVLRAVGAPAAESQTQTGIELNGSRVLALPGRAQTIRGFSKVKRLIIDEAAFSPDELYYAVRPMLAVSGGSIYLLSTPNGRLGFFYKEWSEGGRDWLRIRVPAWECPRIAPEWIERERRRVGDYWFRQEYGCEFLDAEHQVFRTEDIERAFSAGSERGALYSGDVATLAPAPLEWQTGNDATQVSPTMRRLIQSMGAA